MSSTKSHGDDLIGARLADYTIKRLIAKGGMGRVYEALDNELGRAVAIKVITLEEDAADEMLERFKREAKAIGQLDNHPNIITIYRYGKARGVTYIAMQYVNGQSLGEYARDVRDKNEFIDPSDMVDILRQVAEALDYAHEHGVIHRDIKPANVMLESDPNRKGFWRAILMDFGLVLRNNNTMTTGSAFGTPRYIAPEQALSSADANPQSDIYSLGIMVYEMLAGRPPFEDDDTPIGVALSHVTKPPPDPKTIRTDLPDAIVPVLMKVLEKEPEKRYQKATEFIEAVGIALGVGARGNAVPKNIPAPAPVVVAEPPTPPTEPPDSTLMQADIPPTSQEVVAHPLTPASPPPAAETPPVLVPLTNNVAKPVSSGRSWLPIAAGLVVVAALILAALLALSGGGDSGNNTDDEAEDNPVSNENNDSGQETVSSVPAIRDGMLELYYGNRLLLIRNASTKPLDLTGLSLKQGDDTFSLADFGRSTLQRWGIGQCAYIQVLNETIQPLESDCANEQLITPLEYVNDNQLVWLSESDFEVTQDGNRLGTCTFSEGHCIVEDVKQAQ